MPQIKEYVNPVNGLQPDERGIDSAVQAARQADAVGKELNRDKDRLATDVTRLGNENAASVNRTIQMAGEAATNYIDHRLISQGAAAFATFTDKQSQTWDNIIKGYTDADGTVHPPANPNDPGVKQRYMDALEPELAKFKDGFWTERSSQWAEQHIEQLRTHFNTKTTADMATLAHQAVEVNYKQTLNALTNTAMRDPSSVPNLIQQAQSGLAAMVGTSPNLKGIDAAKATSVLSEKAYEQIVKAGAIGAIRTSSNPEKTAEAWSSDPRYSKYISGAEIKQLADEAKRESRAQRLDHELGRRLEKEAREDASEKKQNSYLKDLYSGDEKRMGRVSAREVQNDDGLLQKHKDHVITLMNREMKPETDKVVSNETFVDLYRRINLPEGDPRKITDIGPLVEARGKKAGEQGSISREDFNELHRGLLNQETPEGRKIGAQTSEFLNSVKDQIDDSNVIFGSKDKTGKAKYYQFMTDVKAKMDAAPKNNIDPRSYITPGNPNFMGNSDKLKPYMKTLQESLAWQREKYQDAMKTTPKNITGPDQTITGISVQDLPATIRAIPPGKGYTSPDGSNVYDSSTGKYFDAKTGNEIPKPKK